MTRIKLIATDLDGTLFNDEKEVTEKNKAAIQLARKKGIHFVITTGRPLKAIEYLLKELDLMTEEAYSITFNGGLVQQNTGKILSKSEMTWEEAQTIMRVLYDLGLPIDVLSDGNVYELNQGETRSYYRAVNPHLTFYDIEKPEDLPQSVVINKVISAYEPSRLDDELANLPIRLHEQFEIFKSRDIVLEFMPKGVHKATGLQQLCQYLGITPDEVMAIGDEENDLSMIEWAGYGVAMKNAVPALKEKANIITEKTNQESGVAWAIEQYIGGEGHGII